MKNNSKFYFLNIMLFALVCSGVAAAQQKNALQKAIDKHIAAEAAKEAGAVEYAEGRITVEGDVDGDGDKDTVVQYTLEGGGGGNNYGQSIAVFINTKGAYKASANTAVGGKLSRTFTLKTVSKGKITGATETCTDSAQGACENPKKGTASFSFKKNKLKEL